MTMTPVRRRGTALAAAILGAALVFTGTVGGGAASAQTNGKTRTVEAENGTIKVPAKPKRVATIGNTTVPFLDLGGKPVAVTEVADSDKEVLPKAQQKALKAAKVVGTDGGEVDVEKLASLKPDVILVQFSSSDWDKVGKELETIAPTVFWGLDTEWKTFAGEIATVGNVKGALSEQETAFAAKVAKIQKDYGEIISSDSFVDLNRYSSSDPGTFVIADIGCSEIARDDIGLNLPEAPEGEDPLAYAALPFEQLSSLSKYDVITYPIDANGRPTENFEPVVETNTWKALPAVKSSRALGLFCPNNNTYGPVLQYLDSLDAALATLPNQG